LKPSSKTCEPICLVAFAAYIHIALAFFPRWIFLA
jgi:hypothetical protein